MVYLNEWLPNPTGPDNPKEFIELYNSGDRAVNLSGWFITTEKNKKFSLAGQRIEPAEYLVLKKSVTKLSLRNSEGGLFLYDAGGTLADFGKFLGSAPIGKSFSRMDYGEGVIQHFAFVDATPGAKNNTVNTAIAVAHYPLNTPLNHQLESSGFFAIMMGTGALMVGLVLYVIKTNEDLSNIFFKRNQDSWRTIRETMQDW